MKDSYCRPYTNRQGVPVSGGAAREARIADEGGMDRILDQRELRGFRAGYAAGKEDTLERIDAIEKRLRHLERQ